MCQGVRGSSTCRAAVPTRRVFAYIPPLTSTIGETRSVLSGPFHVAARGLYWILCIAAKRSAIFDGPQVVAMTAGGAGLPRGIVFLA